MGVKVKDKISWDSSARKSVRIGSHSRKIIKKLAQGELGGGVGCKSYGYKVVTHFDKTIQELAIQTLRKGYRESWEEEWGA